MNKKKRVDVSKVLSDVPPNEAFWLYNGIVVRNIYELVEQIKELDDIGFTYHSNPNHDDFASWIRYSLKDPSLAQSLQKERNQKRYVQKIQKRVKKFESEVYIKNKFIFPMKKSLKNLAAFPRKRPGIVTLALVIFVVFLFQSQTISDTQIKKLQSQIIDLQERNIIMQRFISLNLQKSEELEQLTKELQEETPTDIESFYTYQERFTPYDRIREEQIKVYDDKVVIDLEDARWAKFISSGSMRPTFETGANAIEIKPESSADIYVGDIISYQPDGESDIIVHRVVEIGEDSIGWYVITRGDNNCFNDPFKVRFDQILRVLVGIIY